MWARNLLFLGVVGLGLAALTAGLFPHRLPARLRNLDAGDTQTDDFRAAVARVDAAFEQTWKEQQLDPARPAPELAVLRRLSLALTGSPPSLEEVRQFEGHSGDDRVAWWLAGLLRERRFADYFAERLARAYVGTDDGPFVVYRRRRFVAWLSDQLLANRPYDDLVREVIAAQGLWTDKPAVNFITVTMEPDNQKGPNPEKLAAKVARAFLGVRLDCAQCHNHPFQPWEQRQFQALAAFFGQARQGFTGIYDDPQAEYQFEFRKTGTETVAPSVPFLPELLPDDGRPPRARLADWVTDPRNAYFARATVNRVWALLLGRPLVEPVDDLLTTGDVPPALQLLADDFVSHGHDLHRLVQLIAATRVFRLDSAADPEPTEAHDKAWAVFPLTRLRPEQVAGGVLQAASLKTINQDSPLLVRIARLGGVSEFVKRYGDTGADEFDARAGTIPQRLLLMNGQLVHEKTRPELLNASAQIGALAPDDAKAVEVAYLAVLTRRPTPEEAKHFEDRLAGSTGDERKQRLEDLYWTLLNASEFSWNH